MDEQALGMLAGARRNLNKIVIRGGSGGLSLAKGRPDARIIAGTWHRNLIGDLSHFHICIYNRVSARSFL